MGQKQNNIQKPLLLTTLIFSFSVFARSPSSFYKAKKLLYNKIYKDQNQTFYCGCLYKDKVVDLDSCGYKVRKNTKRAKRTEAEHIVPAYWIAHLTKQGKECWTKGTQLQATNGRKHCLKTNKQFKQAHNDLMNLVPAIGEINADRSNYQFAMIKQEKSKYGACDFEVDRSNKTVEPPLNVRGDIARVYFYMQNKYGLKLLDKTQRLMQHWNEIDPISEWEKKRVRRIEEIQGEF